MTEIVKFPQKEIPASNEQPVCTVQSCDIVIDPESELGRMDLEAFLNLRTWLQDLLIKAGAEITDGGMGFGWADIGFMFEGHIYDVKIRPRPTPKEGA